MGFLSKLNKLVDPLGIDKGNKYLANALGGSKASGGQGFDPATISKFDAADPHYRAAYNNAGGASGLGGRSYEQWLHDHLAAHPEDNGNQLLSNIQSGVSTGPSLSQTGGPGMEPVYDTGSQPFEQGFSNYVQSNYVYPDLAADTARRGVANNVLNSYAGAMAANNNLVSNLSGQIDASGYFAAHPDAAAAYQAQASAPQKTVFSPQAMLQAMPELKQYWDNNTGGSKDQYPNIVDFVNAWKGLPDAQPLLAKGMVAAPDAQPVLTPEQFAQKYQATVGAQKGYTLNYGPSKVYGQEINASDADTAAQQAALGTQLSSLRGNLDAQTGSLHSNLDAQVAAMKSGLADQTAAKQTTLTDHLNELRANVSGELAQKTDDLNKFVQQLTNGWNTYSDSEKSALADQLKTRYAALETDVASRKDALQQSLSTMGNAVTAEEAARKTALQDELGKLQAAQAPLNNVRTQAAQSAMTAVNMATEGQKDNLVAQSAAKGYVGDSTGDEMALARVSAQGRQAAAQQMGNAQIANATDNRSILDQNAVQGTSLADEIAKARTGLSNYGATEGRGIADYGSSGTHDIANYGADQNRGIAGTVNQGLLGVNQTGATEGRTINDAAATATKNVNDYGSNEKRTIADFNTDQTRGIGDLASSGNRSINDNAATGLKGVNDFGANQSANISNTGADRKLGFFTNDINRQIASLSLPGQTAQQQFGLLNAADNYSQSGLDRAMQTMNYFNINQGQAPQVNPVLTQANTAMGDSLQNLGAGIVSAAGSYGVANANKTSGNYAGNGGPTSYADFLKNNPSSSAAGGGYTPPKIDTNWSFGPQGDSLGGSLYSPKDPSLGWS